MRRSSFGMVAVLMAGLFFHLLGCEAKPPPEPLRIAMNPWPGYAFFYVAEEKRFFEAEGVAVKLVELSSLGDVRRAFERGQVDGMACTLVEVLLAREQSAREPQIVLITDYSNGPDVILAAEAVPDLASLVGRRVGVEPASLGIFVLARALERAGVDLSSVELVAMDQAQMQGEFARGRVDAVVSYPPVSTKLASDSGARQLFSSAEIPGEIVDVVAMDRRVAAERTADVAALARAWERALEYARTHPEDAEAIISRRAGIARQELQEILGGLELVGLEGQREYFGESGALLDKVAFAQETLRGVRALNHRVPSSEFLSDTPVARALGLGGR